MTGFTPESPISSNLQFFRLLDTKNRIHSHCANAPDHQWGSCGLSEEAEEEILIANDVIEVEGEDPTTPWARFFQGEQGEVVRWRSILWARAPWPDPEESPTQDRNDFPTSVTV